MQLNKIFSYLVPKDKVFYQLFTQATANLVKTAETFSALVNSNSQYDREKLERAIVDLEHKGDDITHSIFTELSTNFITPFDREDIHYLATAIDDIIDNIYGSSSRMKLYKVEEFTPAMKKMVEILEKQTKEIHIAMHNMNGMSQIVRIREALVRIHSLENHADDIFDQAVGDLFETETDAINIIKMKEVLVNIETATDKCEDAANVMESIILKLS